MSESLTSRVNSSPFSSSIFSDDLQSPSLLRKMMSNTSVATRNVPINVIHSNFTKTSSLRDPKFFLSSENVSSITFPSKSYGEFLEKHDGNQETESKGPCFSKTESESLIHPLIDTKLKSQRSVDDNRNVEYNNPNPNYYWSSTSEEDKILRSSSQDSNLTWLQKQQRKLRERRKLESLDSSKDKVRPDVTSPYNSSCSSSSSLPNSINPRKYLILNSESQKFPSSSESRTDPSLLNPSHLSYDSESTESDMNEVIFRSNTPGFPPSTPIFLHPSSKEQFEGRSLKRNTSDFWYKPEISRETALSLLKSSNVVPGTFIVRDSHSFPGAFGLALKVTSSSIEDESSIRHFLIEPSSKGVKLKGYNNEPTFPSLSALITQHSITPLALPIPLKLPIRDSSPRENPSSSSLSSLLASGAACDLFLLTSSDVDSLSGPLAISKTIDFYFSSNLSSEPSLLVHFKVSSTTGITLTDKNRVQFFRKHFHTSSISYMGSDPKNRTFPNSPHELFGFVAKKRDFGNICFVFASFDISQPSRIIINFVNKVISGGSKSILGDV